MKNTHDKIIVLGGGLAGLSAGWKLSKEGLPSVVLEKDTVVGGLAANVKRDGFVFNYGPHCFHTDNEALLDEIKGIFGDDLKLQKRISKILINGKYVDYPLQASKLMDSLDYRTLLSVCKDYFSTVVQGWAGKKSDDTFDVWVKRRFGLTLYNLYFGPYTQKLLGLKSENISSDWAHQRISLLNLTDVLVKLMSVKSRRNARTYFNKYLYPRNGIGELPRAFGEKIKKEGGEILLGSQVKEIKVSGQQVKSIVYCTSKTIHELKCDYLISTIPITHFVESVRPRPPQEIIDCVNMLKFRAMIFVHLVTSVEHLSENSWIYFPSDDFIFTRVSEPRNFSNEMAKDGFGSLTVEVCCDVGDHIWEMPEDVLTEKIVGSLERTGILKQGDVVNHFISRNCNGYPVYEVGYKARLMNVLSYFKQFNNLFFAGRQALFRYCNMDSAIEMGYAAADHLMSASRKSRH